MAAVISRWDWVEDLRRQSVAQIIALEASKHLADEIQRWPPQVSWTDPAQQATFAPLFVPGAPRPSAEAIALGLQLARWELERNLDAVAYALRNGAPDALGDPYGALAARFLWRWLPEWLFELNERCNSRVPRAQLISALEQTAQRLRWDTVST